MITSQISGNVKLRNIIDSGYHFYLVDVIIVASLFLFTAEPTSRN